MMCLDTVCLLASLPLEETFENRLEDLFPNLTILMAWKKVLRDLGKVILYESVFSLEKKQNILWTKRWFSIVSP